jgi:tRNA-uridine 2-sulfurtransferase
MRIVVAMSGGVDSSVAAALLADEGHDVVGLSMQLYDQTDSQTSFGSCCSLDDLHDARRVAAAINIPHYIVNFERQFTEQVVANFVHEYAAGRTPLPCAHCNSELKFATLLDRARGLDADYVATGHYARVAMDDRGRYLLKRGADAAKDQSYFLFSLDQGQLSRALFPIGHLDKGAVRAYARDRKLPVAEKPDSQEICFVPDNDYSSFVTRHVPDVPADGLIVDINGRVLGNHRGIHRFTVGQRRGLGISSTIPLYVLELNAADRTVVVGPREELKKQSLTASGVNWIVDDPPDDEVRVTAQIRHRHSPAPARVRSLAPGRAALVFDEPQSAITPGQAVVFYDGETVVGGGWID